jgi:hypothetical protein
MAARKKRRTSKISQTRVSTLSGEPRAVYGPALLVPGMSLRAGLESVRLADR